MVGEPGIVGRPGDAEDRGPSASGELNRDRTDTAGGTRDRHRICRYEAHRPPPADGLAVHWSAGTVTYSGWLDRRMENPITSSPTAKPVTPEPISATTPARSLPCPDGNVAGNRSRTAPARIAASLILMPAALTSTRTSPAPGTGRGRSRTSRTSMPPYESNWTAFVMNLAARQRAQRPPTRSRASRPFGRAWC